MSTIFALNGLSYLAVSLIAFCIYYLFCKKEEVARKVGSIIGVNGIFYLLMASLNFLWVFGLLEANNEDFILINSGFTVVSSILLLYAVYKITGNRNLVYLLVLFMTSVFAINFSIKAFFITTLAISYLLTIIVFLNLIFFYNFYLRWAGYVGLFYAAASILLLVLIFVGEEAYKLFWFLPTALIFFIFLFIYLDVTNLGIINKIEYKQKKKPLILVYSAVFSKFLIFMASISAFILVSAIAIHELGHALVAQYYGCEQFKAIIYDIIAPHTEIRCDSYYNSIVLTLAGIAATSVIGLVFVLTGGQFTTGISYLLFGIGFLISYGDLTDLGISKNIITVLLLLALVMVILAVVEMSVYYLKEQDVFNKGIKSGIKKLASGEPEVKKILQYGIKTKSTQNDENVKNL